jgi:hypothetical protein
MRKFGLLIIPLLFWGCDKTFENVIDVTTENYQVTFVSGIKDTIDLKTPSDSLLNLRLIFSSGSVVNRVHFNVIDPDDNFLNSFPIEMSSISDVIYENQFILKPEYPNGKYGVQFSVTGFNGESKVVALSGFQFNNGQDNLPPVIANTVIEPDTVVVTDTTVIFTSVEAMDSNGVNDLKEIYYIVYRPDGSTSGAKLLLFDDGNAEENGDLVAGDGIYSRLIQINETNDKGTYRFEFQAEDRSGELSNIINHFVLIQ